MEPTNLVFMTKVRTQPGKEQDVLRASLAVAQAARAQAGCVDYRIFYSPKNAAETMNFEIWKSEEARNTFNAGPDVEMFIEAVSGAFAEPPQVVSYQEAA